MAGTTCLLSPLSGRLPLRPSKKLDGRETQGGSWTGRQPSRGRPRTSQLSSEDQAAAGWGVEMLRARPRWSRGGSAQERSRNDGAHESGRPQVAEKSCPRPTALCTSHPQGATRRQSSSVYWQLFIQHTSNRCPVPTHWAPQGPLVIPLYK